MSAISIAGTMALTGTGVHTKVVDRDGADKMLRRLMGQRGWITFSRRFSAAPARCTKIARYRPGKGRRR